MSFGKMMSLVLMPATLVASHGLQAHVVGVGAARLTAPAAIDLAPFQVSVRVDWQGEPDTDLAAGVVDELAEVWNENGVRVVRYGEEPNRAQQTTVTLVLVRAQGPSGPRGAVGWIEFVQDSRPLPVLYVSMPTARALIDRAFFHQIPGAELPREIRDRLMARVLGRAAAHELGHFLLASRQHAPSGLMRTRFTSEQWVGDRHAAFLLRPGERARVEARMRAGRYCAVACAE